VNDPELVLALPIERLGEEEIMLSLDDARARL
jgi:hypothetical protein